LEFKPMPSKTEAAATIPANPAASFAPTSAAARAVPASDLTDSERRKARRFACEGTAKVVVLGGALTFTGKLQDLSATGCCLRTEIAFTLERGTQVEVVMVVNHASFRVAAGVRSNHKVRGVGLEFVNVSNRSARLIQDLVAELDAQQKREAAKPTA
jgi:c-di-GMP-binding flagellar brake protein YcgR